MSHTLPGIHGDDLSSESSTLVDSGIERFANGEESEWEQFDHVDLGLRLGSLLEQMARRDLDY